MHLTLSDESEGVNHANLDFAALQWIKHRVDFAAGRAGPGVFIRPDESHQHGARRIHHGRRVYHLFLPEFLAEPLRGADGQKEGIVFVLSIVAAFLITGALGLLLERFVIRRLYGRPLDTLLATWGIGLILQQAARSYSPRNLPITSPAWLNGRLVVAEGIGFPYARLFIIALAVICVVGVYIYLYHTSNGRRTRAVMQNREMASALGVATRRVDALTFAMGAGLAGVAGSALTLIGQIGPQLGTGYIVDAFMVVVLGGVGSLPGTVLAALIVGTMSPVFEMSIASAGFDSAFSLGRCWC